MNSLEITVRSSCPLHCAFCPQDKLTAAIGGKATALPLLWFMDCLETVPTDCRIDFSGLVEPMLSPDIGRMIRHAIEKGHEVHLYSTLVGLTYSKADELIAFPPAHIRIHVPDLVGLIIPDDQWIASHKRFSRTGLKATYMRMGPMSDAVGQYLDGLGIEVEAPEMLSRAGNVARVTPPNHAGGVRCGADRWHQNVLLPSGDVVGCCMDYGLTVKLGNLRNQPYAEIYAEAERWRENMAKDASGSICQKCEWAASL